MASIVNDPRGRKRILFVATDGTRKAIRLGKMDRRTAEGFLYHVHQIIGACRSGVGALDEKTAAWLRDLPDTMHGRLARVGLVKPRSSTTVALGAFIDAYIDGRADTKIGTRVNLRQTRRLLVECFGEGRDMRSIGPTEAEDFRLHMVKAQLAENTIRRHVGRARQLFKAAIRRGLISGANPFDGMATTVRSDKARQFFVTRAAADKVIEACPDAQWRLMVALSRYGGLRTPSETLALTWADVDWERGRIRVPSPKTEHIEGKDCRIVPLFAELRKPLLDVFAEPSDGTPYVITRYRDAACNLRTQLGRIIRKAGLNVWPKPWHNMRASRQTELCEEYPIHVVCAWLGNTRAVAQEHYLQVTDAHFAKAVKEPEPALSSAAQNEAQSASETAGNDRKAGKTTNEKRSCLPSVSERYTHVPNFGLTPSGFEPESPA